MIIFGAITVTALGIDAADTLRGNSGTMLGQIISSQSGACPSGMVLVATAMTFSCVDEYEAAWADSCGLTSVNNQMESGIALQNPQCMAESRPKADPWTFVTREQAALACSRASKRLPTAAEWYQFAIGAPDNESCSLDASSRADTGSFPACVSSVGVYDTVGNVWEWVSDDVIDGTINGRALPEKGYVTQVDSGGVATVTADTPDALFGADYFWSSDAGAYGVLRGGYFGSKSDGGVYAFHTKTLPTTAIGSIGFRCVK